MTKRVLVPIADGSEDIETACVTDILVRGGLEVVTASVMPERRTTVTFARGLTVTATKHIDDVVGDHFVAILLPGGMPGAQHLSECQTLIRMLRQQKEEGRLFGAICAAPAVALGPHGLLDGVERATGFPAMKDKLPQSVTYGTEEVVLSQGCLTSQGPGTAMHFGLAALAVLTSAEKASQVANGLLLSHIRPEWFSSFAKM